MVVQEKRWWVMSVYWWFWKRCDVREPHLPKDFANFFIGCRGKLERRPTFVHCVLLFGIAWYCTKYVIMKRDLDRLIFEVWLFNILDVISECLFFYRSIIFGCFGSLWFHQSSIFAIEVEKEVDSLFLLILVRSCPDQCWFQTVCFLIYYHNPEILNLLLSSS